MLKDDSNVALEVTKETKFDNKWPNFLENHKL